MMDGACVCVRCAVQQHENALRPLLALKDTLGRASAGDQLVSSATAKRKAEDALQKARIAAVQEAQSEQDLSLIHI